MTFSIITVCYNAARFIAETVESVLKQDFVDYEYIIIDGKSSDDTVDIIYKYIENGADIKFISEPDNGIYDAMNKGALLAQGKWCLFLNASDYFASSSVLSNVSANIESDDEFVYGSSIVRYKNRNEFCKHDRDLSTLWMGPAFRHNALFIPTQIIKNQLYNLDRSYKICADYDFIFRNYTEGKRFRFINETIIEFEAEGASSNPIKNLKDTRMVALKYDNTREHRRYYRNELIRYYSKKIAILMGARVAKKVLKHILNTFRRIN